MRSRAPKCGMCANSNCAKRQEISLSHLLFRARMRGHLLAAQLLFLRLLACALVVSAQNGTNTTTPPPPAAAPAPVIVTTLSIPYTRTACSAGLYFDTSALSCIACPTASSAHDECSAGASLNSHCCLLQGYFPTADKLSCEQCDTTDGFFYATEDGFGTSMTWIASPSLTTCSCPVTTNATIIATVFSDGALKQRCVVCPAGYTVSAVIDALVSGHSYLSLSWHA